MHKRKFSLIKHFTTDFTIFCLFYLSNKKISEEKITKLRKKEITKNSFMKITKISTLLNIFCKNLQKDLAKWLWFTTLIFYIVWYFILCGILYCVVFYNVWNFILCSILFYRVNRLLKQIIFFKFQLRVRAYDSNNKNQFVEENVLINVIRNINPPRFVQRAYTRTISEDMAITSLVVNTTATDADNVSQVSFCCWYACQRLAISLGTPVSSTIQEINTSINNNYNVVIIL